MEKETWKVVATYLKANISVAKKQLGSQCTYLSLKADKVLNEETGIFETVNSFYAVMKNDLGSKDKVSILLDKEPHLLDPSDFKSLVFTLNSRNYGSSGATV